MSQRAITELRLPRKPKRIHGQVACEVCQSAGGRRGATYAVDLKFDKEKAELMLCDSHLVAVYSYNDFADLRDERELAEQSPKHN